MAATDVHAPKTAERDPGHERTELAVEGMHCASCAVRIERVLSRQPGVAEASVNFATHRASMAYDAGAVSVPERSEERRVGKECRSRWSPYH